MSNFKNLDKKIRIAEGGNRAKASRIAEGGNRAKASRTAKGGKKKPVTCVDKDKFFDSKLFSGNLWFNLTT